MSNDNKTKVTLEFHVTDLPAIAHAFAIASTTAMMCGHPDAQKRLNEYRSTVDQLIPEAARVFEGEVWCEIGMAVAHAKEFSVHFEQWGYSWGAKGEPSYAHGQVLVTIGEKRWHSDDYKISKHSGRIEAVKELLHTIAPLDAVHIDLPDTDYQARYKRTTPTAKPADPVDDEGSSFNP